MKQGRILQTTIILLSMVFVLAAGGCTWSSNLNSCRQENRALAQQMADLEYQLAQADKAATAQATPQVTPSPTLPDYATYLVVSGDNLWRIAVKQLGSGKRYKEILALNPQITQAAPLTIGTTLKLPAK
ncbi:MAG: LysM peptidoglycan-binding domain-containing protein [Planctomycetes bacterium]|nr:LysM peptidoglycan-binding domain-containing protein [Planctomycetota bacterium]